jgi:two-component system, CAI-1 autoinducer sensor kinase/phosphatase CqsS
LYSILPALVAAIFLGYGIYAVSTKGVSRITLSFFVLCLTSFSWQGTWAVLFQIRDPQLATFLVKLGYFFILFLPTSLYHFLTEISESRQERSRVYFSYIVAGTFAVFVMGSDLFISGYYTYFWGYYPKAGLLHPLHMIQTAIVVNRGLYLIYRQRNKLSPYKQTKLNLCIGGVLTYFFAAVDYACNYGVEYYPPGVIFIAIALGIITIAVSKYDLLNPLTVAATVAHEVRTPLISIRMQARGIARYLPALLQGYDLAVQNGLCESSLRPDALKHLSSLGDSIMWEIDRTNVAIDMLLASVKLERFDRDTFSSYSIVQCVNTALDRYSFDIGERACVHVNHLEEFSFYGSETLLTMVVFNLLKNALYAIRTAGRGRIEISTLCSPVGNTLLFRDTGTGIASNVVPRIFEPFFTTRKSGGSGLGLAFCQRAMTSFDGSICCNSVVGEFTLFTLEFPPLDEDTMSSLAQRNRRTEGASMSAGHT